MTYTVSPQDLERCMDAIVQNEELLFGNEGYDHEDFMFFEKQSRYTLGLILTPSEQLAAYAVLKNLKPGIVRMLRLCVLPEHRKKGYGKNLHDAIMVGGHEYRLRVPERWLETQIWLRNAGWLAVGIAPDGIEFRIVVDSDPFVVS